MMLTSSGSLPARGIPYIGSIPARGIPYIGMPDDPEMINKNFPVWE